MPHANMSFHFILSALMYSCFTDCIHTKSRPPFSSVSPLSSKNLKYVFFQNSPSVSSLWEVAITPVDVVELFTVTVWISCRAAPCSTSIQLDSDVLPEVLKLISDYSAVQEPDLAQRLPRLSNFRLVLSWQANTRSSFFLSSQGRSVNVFFSLPRIPHTTVSACFFT